MYISKNKIQIWGVFLYLNVYHVKYIIVDDREINTFKKQESVRRMGRGQNDKGASRKPKH